MTLTDIISKIILYAKQAIVNDNSSGTALSVNQSGSGDAARFQGGNPLKGTLKIFSGTGSDFDYDGGSDGVFVFSNTSSAPTKATAFSGANVGIDTSTPGQKLDVNGGIRTNNVIYLNNNAGTNRFVSYQSNQVERWHIGVDNTAESGANSGSNFFIHRFDDSGTFLSRVVNIDRASGNVGINTSSPAKTLHVNGTVRLQGLPTFASNAAAIAGGLAVGDVYIDVVSGQGELRIVI